MIHRLELPGNLRGGENWGGRVGVGSCHWPGPLSLGVSACPGSRYISFFYIQLFNRKTTPNCNEFKVRKTGCSFSVVATTLNRNWLGVVADAAGLPTIPNQLRLGVVFQQKNFT